MKNPLVSITITTKNEEKNIENCLKSIRFQDYVPIEIIVVDNGSTDRTKEIAGKYTEKVLDKGPERSAQRNFGMIDHSEGKYAMYIDADMILSPGLIAACVEAIQKNKYSALHISEVVLGTNYFSKVRRFERSFYDGTSIDGARFFNREDFIKTGGFDLALSGPEDWDMDKMIKKSGKIGLLKKATDPIAIEKWEQVSFIRERGINPRNYGECIFHNESEFDLKKYLSKKGYYAKSFDLYVRKWGKNDPDTRRQLGFFYRILGVFLEHWKWVKLITHPILAAGMYFLRFLVGWMMITQKK